MDRESRKGETFVGRRREMAELRTALDDAVSGRGRLIILAGEPGIGKTRMAQELAANAEEFGGQVLWGRCHEGPGRPPYWPWVQLIRSYVRNCDAERLGAEMGPGAAIIAEFVPEVGEKLPGLPPPTGQRSNGHRREQIKGAELKGRSNGRPGSVSGTGARAVVARTGLIRDVNAKLKGGASPGVMFQRGILLSHVPFPGDWQRRAGPPPKS